MIDNVQAFLSEHVHRRIGAGKSGADVWAVESDMLLKHARRKAVTDLGVWHSYQKEAQMYLWFQENSVSFVPEVLYARRTAEEVFLLLKRYRMLRHEEARDLLPDILRMLAKIHSLPAPEFLETPERKNTALPQAQVAACLHGWESVLEEHGDRFHIADAAFVAEHINMLNERFYPDVFVLVHGDFHCDNLLLDAHGEVIVCDWQNAHIGPPAGDIAFFLSRLSADGIFLDTDELIEKYCSAAKEEGVPAERESIRCGMTLSDLNTAFLFWHQYLHGNPPERVGGIFEKMVLDARWLLERR